MKKSWDGEEPCEDVPGENPGEEVPEKNPGEEIHEEEKYEENAPGKYVPGEAKLMESQLTQLTLVGGETANEDVPGEPFKSLLIRLGQDWLLSHRAFLERKNNTLNIYMFN